MEKLKKRITHSVQEYEEMLKIVKDPDGLRVIKSTIKTLKMQLKKLEVAEVKPLTEEEEIKLKLEQVKEEINHVQKMLKTCPDPHQFATLKIKRRNLYHVKRTYEMRLEKLAKVQVKRNLTKEQKEDIGLKRLFTYFTKQQRIIGQNPNFDKLYSIDREMNINHFMIFCQKYKIICNKKTNRTGML